MAAHDSAPVSSSVVIAAYTLDRWTDIVACVRSCRAQKPPPTEVILAVDNNEPLAERASAQLRTEARVVPHRGPRGASGARNAGAKAARGDVLVFLDDDAVALPGWLSSLVAPLRDARVIGTGGRIEPAWRARRPPWFPEEFLWAVGATYRGMPTQDAPVRNVWSGNMAVRRSDFLASGGFREDFGKVGNTARPEDTDFCIRFTARFPGTYWQFVPSASIAHAVPAERTRLSWYLRRCLNEGRGKAELAAHVGAENGLSSERGYATSVVPRGIGTEMRRAATTADPWAAARAATMAAGLTCAAFGFAVGKVSRPQARRC